MKWVPDATGRLAERPHYLAEEIDQECESRVATFLRRGAGRVAFPLSTNALTILLEQDASDLDLYADLSGEGAGVEGITELVAGGAPRVRIARELSEDPAREVRLRMTLAHELGHVWLHAFLWRERRDGSLPAPRCYRATIERPPAADWLEWQAARAGGAILMPRDELQRLTERAQAAHAFRITPGTAAGAALIATVEQSFQVSHQAARVRLAATGLLATPGETRPTRGRRRRPALSEARRRATVLGAG